MINPVYSMREHETQRKVILHEALPLPGSCEISGYVCSQNGIV